MQATQSKPSPGQLGESHPVSRINVVNICLMQKKKIYLIFTFERVKLCASLFLRLYVSLS